MHVCLALASGCGADDEAPSAELPDTLGYVPRDATAVAIVPTDVEGERAAELLRELGVRVAVDGDTVLFAEAFDENARMLDEAIVRHEAGEEFDPAAFARALGDEADDDAEGAAVGRTDRSTWPEPPFDLPTRPLGKAVSELEAATEGLDGRVRIEVPDGLD